MKSLKNSPIVLVAEDDDEDFMLTREAYKNSKFRPLLYRVKDGEELMDFLLRRGKFNNPSDSPRPHMLLLDLNMPRKNGWEALEEIKSHSELRHIPVVVLSVSGAEEDVQSTYHLGANSFIKKSLSFQNFINTIQVMNHYWFEQVVLPSPIIP